jgi:CBS domain-containing protein
MTKLLKNRLPKARVADVMAREIVYVNPDDTVREALELMLDNHVSALPVIDNHARCVGVLSATDILNLTQEVEEELAALSTSKGPAYRFLIERLSNSEMSTESVRAVMTQGVICVHADASIEEAAAEMVRHHVHRVIVVDDQQHLVGIVSTMDVMRAIAKGKR